MAFDTNSVNLYKAILFPLVNFESSLEQFIKFSIYMDNFILFLLFLLILFASSCLPNSIYYWRNLEDVNDEEDQSSERERIIGKL